MKKQDDNFDKYADNYRNIHTKNIKQLSGKDSNFFTEYKIKEISHLFKNKKRIRILDVGCGDGNSAKYFLEYFKNIEYIGIDISSDSIKVARNNNNNSKFHFEVYDGKNIPFEQKSFDLVFIACVMHHVSPKNHISLLKECKRVLKNDGTVIIFEHNPYNPLTLKTVNNCPFDKDAILMSSRYLRKTLKYCCYSNINLRYTFFIPRYGFLEKITFIEKYLFWLPIGGQYYVYANK